MTFRTRRRWSNFGHFLMAKFFLYLAIIVLIAGGILFLLRDGEKPKVALPALEGRNMASPRPMIIQVSDQKSGIGKLEVKVLQNGQELSLLSKTYPDHPKKLEETLALNSDQLKEGEMTLRITAKDNAAFWSNAGRLNRTLQFDRTPPVISVQNQGQNLRQSGSGLIVYSISEEPSATGVMVGEKIFPAYKQPSGNYFCFFSFPFNVKRDEFRPLIFVEDQAGNRSETDFGHRARAHVFRQDRINISDRFLNLKMPQFRDSIPASVQTPLETFLAVNRDVRQANAKKLEEFSRNTSGTPLWEGVFLRHPGKTMAIFGDHRTYFYQGQAIDQQTHLGVDLASVVQAEVKAANAGKVVFAGTLGIYGNCIIIDHGLGVQSIYSHLSRIDVKEGQSVETGTPIARTGATGMAGGDHLHFGILVAGLPVDPVEWWDKSWIKENITNKLSDNDHSL
ncbi:MAG: M23 family metallopeptidase [Deltaproteobacteria bacterium]|nr:M23 family metallopeptidase [Deltaproteobacteria bacterium]